MVVARSKLSATPRSDAASPTRRCCAAASPCPTRRRAPSRGVRPCSFLVHYPGPASDLNAWNRHYNLYHPPLMARFPGVRLVEIYTRLDAVSGLGWPAESVMQRNKLMFDTPAALTGALASPVLQEMRADFNSFPPFEGGNVHYALETRIIDPTP